MYIRKCNNKLNNFRQMQYYSASLAESGFNMLENPCVIHDLVYKVLVSARVGFMFHEPDIGNQLVSLDLVPDSAHSRIRAWIWQDCRCVGTFLIAVDVSENGTPLDRSSQ